MSDKKIDDGGPAFPWEDTNNTECQPYASAGMTLRDWFAGQALAGTSVIQLSESFANAGISDPELTAKAMASMAYGVADAMIETRKQ